MFLNFDSDNKFCIYDRKTIQSFTFFLLNSIYSIYYRRFDLRKPLKCYFIFLFSITLILSFKIKSTKANRLIDSSSTELSTDNAQIVSIDESNLFKQVFSKNKINCPKATITNGHTATVNILLNPTVVKATAIRVFQIADTNSYSIAFQIKKIFKYENRVFSQISDYDKNMKNFHRISSQDNNSNEINLNSFILVEYIDLNVFKDEECGNNNNNKIKVGSDYYLFLKSLDPSIKLEYRRYFTFPIASNLLNLSYKIAYKNINFQKFSKYNNDTYLLKMPIFEASFTPTLVTIDSKTESKIENLLCFLDAYCLVSTEQDKIAEAKKSSDSRTNKFTQFTTNKPNSMPAILTTKIKVGFQTVENNKAPITDTISFKYKQTSTVHARINQKQLNFSSAKKINSINTRSQYVKCERGENTCENNGECFRTNENFYLFKSKKENVKIKFCICKEFFEGPNCEFSLMNSIYYDADEIPDDFKLLWNEAGKIDNNKVDF